MNRLLWLSMLAVIFASGALAASSQDEEAIQKVISGWASAWSRHDAKAVSEFYAPQGWLVPPPGERSKGRAEIEKSHREIFKGWAKAATLKWTIDEITFLRPDVAVVSGKFAQTGADLPMQPAGPAHAILSKEGSRWLITAHYLMIPVPPPGSAERQKVR